MRRRQVLVFAAGTAALLGTGCGQASAARPAGLWGRAIAVPGLAALNMGRNASVLSVSCASPGNCAAGGFYKNHGIQGFVVSERKARWRRAVEVPGLGALNKGRQAKVLSVSCASPGDCAAGGYYGNHGGAVTSGRGFVAVDSNGRWRRAIKVPGLAALSKGGSAEVSSVSCVSAGSCTAGGSYTDGSGDQQGFVVTEVNGVWRRAIGVPGLAALSEGGNPYVPAGVSSVSCASPGNCAAGGDYYAAGLQHAFVVSEKNGVWGTAQQVAVNLNTSGEGYVDTVSCGSAGNCVAGGQYGGGEAFVVSEVNGTWAPAREVAGRLNIGGFGWVGSVSCASAGNCSAGGAYDYGGYNAPFVVGEKNGVWGRAMRVSGLVIRDAWVSSVSCASAGNCGAGGGFDGAGVGGFVVGEKNGAWGEGFKVSGPGGPSVGVSSVSCASPGSCVAGGSYQGAGPGIDIQGFVT